MFSIHSAGMSLCVTLPRLSTKKSNIIIVRFIMFREMDEMERMHIMRSNISSRRICYVICVYVCV